MTMAASKSLAAFLAATLLFALASADYQGTATFYGGPDAAGTMGTRRACGYGNLYNTGYGNRTAALSKVLFNDGAACGQCFQIKCDYQSAPEKCRQNAYVIISATNLCPPNPALDSNNGGWCNEPRAHFDMAEPAWLEIGSNAQAGIIPVLYQRVSCVKRGGVRFTINGKNYFELVLVTNVGGSGAVQAMWVKSETGGQVAMSRNWGANWQCLAGLAGKALTFGVTTTGGQTIVFNNIVPANWFFGLSFISNLQFSY